MRLFETMRLENGHIPRLNYHVKRIQRASEHFNMPFDKQQWDRAVRQLQQHHPTGQYRVKISLDATGTFYTDVGHLQSTAMMTAQLVPLEADTPEWQRTHKTTERQHLVHPTTTQLALFYESQTNKVLEFDIGNVVLETNGQFMTPVYEHDFLQGCMRQVLLATNELTEVYLTVEMIESALQQGSQLWMINSLREWVPVTLQQTK